MRIRVDQKADAVYVNLTDRAIEASQEIVDGIVVAKRTADPNVLQQFSLDLPGVA